MVKGGGSAYHYWWIKALDGDNQVSKSGGDKDRGEGSQHIRNTEFEGEVVAESGGGVAIVEMREGRREGET